MKRLAFVYHPTSFATMDIHAAADGVCELVWVVDHDLGETPSMVRLLRRLGEVVDVTGLDHDAAAARIAQARPDGILALHDELLSWTAEVAARLELPFHRPETAASLSDKRAQRAALAAGGVPTPVVLPVPPLRDRPGLKALLSAATFPSVVKPRRSDRSRNTVVVGSRGALLDALDEIARRTPADRDALQLESYLADRPEAVTEGDAFADYVSVESIVIGGRPRHLAITGRFPLAPPLRETGLFLPAAMAPDDERATLAMATAAVEALGVERGCLHTEIKMTPVGPRVIEVNGRIGGGVPRMLHDVTGLELLPMALRCALDEQGDVAPLPPATGVAYLVMRQLPPALARIVSIDGLDDLRAHAGVREVIVNAGPGREVDWRMGTDESVFRVAGVAADHDALLALRRAIEHDVDVVAEPTDEDENGLRTRLGAFDLVTALNVVSAVSLLAAA